MNNSWNKIIYKIWSPIYDKIFNSGIFLKARKEVFQDINFNKQQKILFVGVGTGADLELINDLNLNITAIDYSSDMLLKAKNKFSDSSIDFLQMDAQNMDFSDFSFDIIVASLILSVVPDPNQCFSEMKRVLKPNGKIIIFDKFIKDDLSFSKRLVRPIIKLLGTDIGIHFDHLFSCHSEGLKVEEDRSIMLKGMYRKIVIRKCTSL